MKSLTVTILLFVLSIAYAIKAIGEALAFKWEQVPGSLLTSLLGVSVSFLVVMRKSLGSQSRKQR